VSATEAHHDESSFANFTDTTDTMDQQTAFNQEVARLLEEQKALQQQIDSTKAAEIVALGKETKAKRSADAAGFKAQKAIEKTVAAVQITQAAREKWLGTTERLQQLKQEYLHACEKTIDEKLNNMSMK
jgi:regulator of replication initiation timing